MLNEKKKFLNDVLYQYQTEYNNRLDKLDITNKSRQIGFTSGCIAPKALTRCIVDGIDQMLISTSQRQANVLMSYVEKWWERYAKYIYPEFRLVKDSVTVKSFNNGKSIYSLPPKPETIRGFAGDIRFDEFALMKEDRKCFEALLPSIVKKKQFQISISSTPLGQSNMFFEIFNDSVKYPDFHRQTINCYDAIKLGCEMDLDIIKRNYDEESFRQEFLCEFIDESTSYFTYELLRACISDYNSFNGTCYIGIDIGRTHDLTAIAVIYLIGDVFYLKECEVLRNVDFRTQKDTIKRTIQENNAERVLIDKGAIGMQLAEELENELFNCEGVQMNTNFKNEIVTNCKKIMEQGNFRMPDDREILTDFHAIKRSTTLANISFDSPRDKRGHGDRAWAIMTGIYAAKEIDNIHCYIE